MDFLMTSRLLYLLMLVLPSLVMAQTTMRDPTLPPAAFSAGQSDTGATADEFRLEAIRRPRNGQAEALINGEFWRVGQMLGARKIIRIGESEVVLRGGGGLDETLRMSPSVEKIMKTNRKDRPGAGTSARGGV